MNTIQLILKNIKVYGIFLLLALVILLSVLLFNTYNSLKLEKNNREYYAKIDEQNRKALTDSLTKFFNEKTKQWETEKAAYVLNLEDLKNYNKNLYNKVKKLEGDIAFLISSTGVIDIGKITVGNELIKYNNNKYGLKFDNPYKDDGLTQEISGVSKFYAIPDIANKQWIVKSDSTIFEKNKMTLNISYGMREIDNKYNIFAISSSPKVQFTDLTGGYFLDKQPEQPPQKVKRWGIGPYFGWGIYNENFKNSDLKIGVSAGFSIHYSIIKF
jgi:hypothetical protein